MAVSSRATSSLYSATFSVLTPRTMNPPRGVRKCGDVFSKFCLLLIAIEAVWLGFKIDEFVFEHVNQFGNRIST